MRRRSARAAPRALATTLATALVALPATAAAQRAEGAPRIQAEGRLDVIASRVTALHAALGANAPLGNYLRVGAAAGGGAVLRDGRAAASARAEVVARFLADPFLQFRRGLYAGGGISARVDEGTRLQGRLLLVLGVEGGTVSGVRPSVELGLGGGGRLGVVWRRARVNRR